MLCPNCQQKIKIYKNPVPTVDIIIEVHGDVVLISRKNPPLGWAIPGGFVDYGESLEDAAVREAKEETGLNVKLVCQLHTYSDPRRDKRQHTISTVFIAKAAGKPVAGDDAAKARLFNQANLPPLVFDHQKILQDYFFFKEKNYYP